MILYALACSWPIEETDSTCNEKLGNSVNGEIRMFINNCQLICFIGLCIHVCVLRHTVSAQCRFECIPLLYTHLLLPCKVDK